MCIRHVLCTLEYLSFSFLARFSCSVSSLSCSDSAAFLYPSNPPVNLVSHFYRLKYTPLSFRFNLALLMNLDTHEVILIVNFPKFMLLEKLVNCILLYLCSFLQLTLHRSCFTLDFLLDSNTFCSGNLGVRLAILDQITIDLEVCCHSNFGCQHLRGFLLY